MHYYLYEIKNTVNGKIYVGVHKTKSLDDGYMGSGKVVSNAIRKYGIEHFTKTILETFDNPADMFAREKEVVNDEFLARPDVYNLRRGGTGGFDYINSEGLQKVARKNANKTMESRYGENFLSLLGVKGTNTQRINGQLAASAERIKQFSGMKSEQQKINSLAAMNSAEAVAKKKLTWQDTNRGKGENNSQFGSIWITDETSNRKIKKTALIPAGWRKGRVQLQF